jgi:uncharacterized protein HemY
MKKTFLLKRIVTLLVFSGLSACASTSDNGSKSSDENNQTLIVDEARLEEQEFIEFVTKLGERINAVGFSALFEAIDVKALVTKTDNLVQQKYPSAPTSAPIVERLLPVFTERLNGLLSGDAMWSYVKVMEISQDGNHCKSLVRIFGDAGLAYHVLYLTKSQFGIKITDLYQYHVNMELSETIAHMVSYPKIIENLARYGFHRFGFDKFDFAKNDIEVEKKVKEIRANLVLYNNAVVKRDYEEIKLRFEELPLQLKQDNLILTSRIEVATLYGDETYLDALSALDRFATESMRRSWYYVDYYIMTEQYQKAYEFLDQWQALNGKEAGIYGVYAKLYLMQNYYDKAKEYSKKAINIDPDFRYSYDVLYAIFLAEKRYSDVILILEIMKTKFNYNYDRTLFEDNPELSDFVNSPEYAEWSKQLQTTSNDEDIYTHYKNILSNINCDSTAENNSDSESIAQLKLRITSEYQNSLLWQELGRLYYRQKCYEASSQAFEQSVVVARELSADLLLAYADSLAMANGRNMIGKPKELVIKALEMNPSHTKGLWLLGTAYYQEEDYVMAKNIWEALLEQLPPDSSQYTQIEDNIKTVDTIIGNGKLD